MSDSNPRIGFIPPVDPHLLPPGWFDTVIARIGQRVGWMKSHACPCTWSQAFDGIDLANQNQLSLPGSPQNDCATCAGVGVYWDAPSLPFQVAMTFRHLSPSPDEPGSVTDQRFGTEFMSEPALTIPFSNPYLESGDPRQSTTAWQEASTFDIFCAVDMTARYSAVLCSGPAAQQILPFQQNLSVAPSGAVTIWSVSGHVVIPVTGYAVSGAAVTLPAGYPDGTSYMVEFTAASLFVAYRRAGGLPHVRPFGGGTVNEPKVFRLKSLDFWMRQRGIQPVVKVGGQVLALSVT